MSAVSQGDISEGPTDGDFNKLGHLPVDTEDSKDNILGMISHQSDLLLFNRSVAYNSKPEVWLLKTEFCAHETIGKLIGNAVSSFPKQPLDEWIVDYPQQTILSTIHLILTHEINEMLHEMRLARGTEDPTMSQSGMTETLGINDTSNLNTRSNHQLQDMSKATESVHQPLLDQEEGKIEEEADEDKESDHQEGEGESEKSEAEGEGESHKEGKDSKDFLEEKKTEESKVDKSQGQTPVVGRLTLLRKKEEEAKQKEILLKQQEEKDQYINDMFGCNFDITKITEGVVNSKTLKVQPFKDEAMKALQEKSFQGLYLRLQFWINQIYKRLHTKKAGCGLKLDKTHIMVMKTIICFLSYMRDVVMDLRQKGIDDYESYDWQKQIRLTWNASEPACKVE